MKTRFYKIIFLFSCLTFFTSCNNDDVDNAPPRDFEIVQVGEFYNKVLLRWTESTDPENSIITYNIYIKEDIVGVSYELVKEGLIDASFSSNGNYNGYSINKPTSSHVYSYPILDLEDGKNWNIKITAMDEEGNSKEIMINASTKLIIEVPPLGINYTSIEQTFPEFSRWGHSVVEFKNKLWIIGGRNGFAIYNDVWSSNDGISWELVIEQAPFGVRFSHGSFVFNNKLWVIGGLDFSNASNGKLRDVWTSEDGINWENVSSMLPEYSGEHVAVLNNRIWLMAGDFEYYQGTLYESSDGITWDRNTSFGTNGYTYPEDLKVFDSKIWIANHPDLNKTLTSLDPIANTVKTYRLPGGYFNRSNQQLGILRNRLVVLFGYQNQTPLKDLWSSPDGINWVREESFDYGIYNHKSISFNNKIFVFGGATSSDFNDVFNENILIVE